MQVMIMLGLARQWIGHAMLMQRAELWRRLSIDRGGAPEDTGHARDTRSVCGACATRCTLIALVHVLFIAFFPSLLQQGAPS